MVRSELVLVCVMSVLGNWSHNIYIYFFCSFMFLPFLGGDTMWSQIIQNNLDVL